MKWITWLAATPLFACVLFAATASAEPPKQPNVIIIFIDDMGYGDVGFNGAKGPKTPNLDKMGADGMIFNDFYVGCAVCSGSRTSLMTGCHYQRLSMNAVLFPNSGKGLHPDEITIAEMLKAAGYRTACIGKWHLGHLPPCLPTYQGFEYYYGIPYSNDMWIDPANKLAKDIEIRNGLTREDLKKGHKKRNWVPLFRGEEVIEYPADQATLTKRYTEEAIRFINAGKDKPFFLYLPHTMVHLPLAVSKAFAGRTGKLIWDAIEEVDWSVGEILKAVKTAGISEKTLVIFTSDNGAAVGSSLPLRAKKGSVYDGGIREPTVMWWPGQIPAGKTCREVAATIDILPTLAGLCGGKLPDRKIDGLDIRPFTKVLRRTHHHRPNRLLELSALAIKCREMGTEIEHITLPRLIPESHVMRIENRPWIRGIIAPVDGPIFIQGRLAPVENWLFTNLSPIQTVGRSKHKSLTIASHRLVLLVGRHTRTGVDKGRKIVRGGSALEKNVVLFAAGEIHSAEVRSCPVNAVLAGTVAGVLLRGITGFQTMAEPGCVVHPKTTGIAEHSRVPGHREPEGLSPFPWRRKVEDNFSWQGPMLSERQPFHG